MKVKGVVNNMLLSGLCVMLLALTYTAAQTTVERDPTTIGDDPTVAADQTTIVYETTGADQTTIMYETTAEVLATGAGQQATTKVTANNQPMTTQATQMTTGHAVSLQHSLLQALLLAAGVMSLMLL